MQQDQDIKGFTLLELLVVIAIIAVVSAGAYPGYTKWKKDREARAALEKVVSLLTNLSTQTQRGSFAYTQLLVLPLKKLGGGNTFAMWSRGMRDNDFAKELTDNKGKTTCDDTGIVGKGGNWSDIGGLNFYEHFDPEIGIDELNVSTHVTLSSAVCFGRGGNYYKTSGSLLKINNKNINLDGHSTPNYLIICYDTTCDTNALNEPTYLVKWSRFGNISKYRYVYKQRKPNIIRYNYTNRNAWVRQ